MSQNKELFHDPYRPKYHFLPLKNWINDPNGPVYYKGEFHLFYQHNPIDEIWGNIHWGHAKSRDLVNWEHLPIALTPSIEQGEHHCFSGSCVIDNGVPTIIYTSIGPERLPLDGAEQWLAFSKDDMMTWVKCENNPIMTLDLHDKQKIWEWRDPYVWKEKSGWFAALSGHVRENKRSKRPLVLLYHSHDLREWKYVKPLCLGNQETGKNWECPNFFPLNDKHVLIVSVSSPKKKVIYSVNTYENLNFEPMKWHIVDHGQCFYAPNTMRDPNGRILMWGWIQGGGKGGWNGCLTLPREVMEGSRNTLLFKPISELDQLRKNHFHFELIELNSEIFTLMEKIEDLCLELIIEIEKQDYGILMVSIVDSTGSSCETLFTIDFKTNELKAGSDKATLSHLNDNKNMLLHFFIDRSVIEIFANYNTCLTSRFYFKNVQGVRLIMQLQEGTIKDGTIKLTRIDAWDLNHIWDI